MLSTRGMLGVFLVSPAVSRALKSLNYEARGEQSLGSIKHAPVLHIHQSHLLFFISFFFYIFLFIYFFVFLKKIAG